MEDTTVGESDHTCSTLGSTLQSVLNQTSTPGIQHDRDFRVVLGPFCTQRMKLLQRVLRLLPTVYSERTMAHCVLRAYHGPLCTESVKLPIVYWERTMAHCVLRAYNGPLCIQSVQWPIVYSERTVVFGDVFARFSFISVVLLSADWFYVYGRLLFFVKYPCVVHTSLALFSDLVWNGQKMSHLSVTRVYAQSVTGSLIILSIVGVGTLCSVSNTVQN